MDKAVIATAFPKARSVARTLGVSQARATKLVSLMDRIAINGHVKVYRKARVAKKKKK